MDEWRSRICRIRSTGSVIPVSPTTYERTEPGDGAPDDQCVHLPRAFVGVDGFGVGDEASDVVLQENPVATQ